MNKSERNKRDLALAISDLKSAWRGLKATIRGALAKPTTNQLIMEVY